MSKSSAIKTFKNKGEFDGSSIHKDFMGWTEKDIEDYVNLGSQSSQDSSRTPSQGHGACPEAVEAATAIMLANGGRLTPQVPVTACVAPAPQPLLSPDSSGTSGTSAEVKKES